MPLCLKHFQAADLVAWGSRRGPVFNSQCLRDALYRFGTVARYDLDSVTGFLEAADRCGCVVQNVILKLKVDRRLARL